MCDSATIVIDSHGIEALKGGRTGGEIGEKQMRENVMADRREVAKEVEEGGKQAWEEQGLKENNEKRNDVSYFTVIIACHVVLTATAFSSRSPARSSVGGNACMLL